ncbi:MAG: hypothetical protein GDA45_00945 [Chromatiales bacterium]|nr:hypothetical protein [Chromatiales bacterium]
MKKRLVLIFASVVLITILVLSLIYPGEIVLKLDGYPNLAINLYLFIVLLTVLILIANSVTKLITGLFKLPAYLSHTYHRRQTEKEQQLFHEGLQLYLQGDYAQANQLLMEAAQSPHLQLIASLFATDAALLNNNTKAARKAIMLSGVSHGKNDAADIITADIAIGDETPANAAFRINDIIDKKTNNLRAVRMLIKLCDKTQTWHFAERALQNLDKALYDTPHRQQQIRMQIITALLKQYAEQKDRQRFHRVWQLASKEIKEKLLVPYTSSLVQLGDIKEAERYLEKMIEKDCSSSAIEQYGLLSDIGVEHRIQRAERWLTRQPDHPELLLCLARLHNSNDQLDIAKEYFEKSLAVKPDYRAWSALNKL